MRNTHAQITYTDEKFSKDTLEPKLEGEPSILGKDSMDTERSQSLLLYFELLDYIQNALY